MAAHPWWSPAPGSEYAGLVDEQFRLSYLVVGAIFILAQLGLAVFLWRYRERGRAAQHAAGNLPLEIIWTTLAALLFFGLNLAGSRIFAETYHPAHAAAPVPVEVEITGAQFAWYFRYPGADGKFGRTLPRLVEPSGGTRAAIGLDESDAGSRDDIASTILVVPLNRPVHATLHAQDVIHSFFVPELRFKQDAVPGMASEIWFTPTRAGDFEIACAELCGTGHYKMHSLMRVVSEAEFEAWIKTRAPEAEVH